MNAILFKLYLVQGVCPLKIEINFLTDSVLIFLQLWSRYLKCAQGWTVAFPADEKNNFLDCSYSCSLIYTCNNKEERTKAMLDIHLVSIVFHFPPANNLSSSTFNMDPLIILLFSTSFLHVSAS